MVIGDVELKAFDLRYEGYRMKNPPLEAKLLVSIAERGIEEPLEGVDAGDQRILLNGFKRYRCAQKLGLGMVPYATLGEDEATGIVAMLRTSNQKALSLLEQARFIDDLHTLYKLSVAEIAETLSRSKSWVTMRLGILAEMGERVREKVFSGAFPVYSYMYTLRQLLRTGGAERGEVEKFVEAVGGRKLSLREIEHLAQGCFRGPEWFRAEVLAGNLALALERMKGVPQAPDGANEFERVLLRDLECLGKYLARVVTKSQDSRIETRAFSAQANLLLCGLVSRLGALTQALRSLHDRTGNA
jgi:predicted transcriptional regulator